MTLKKGTYRILACPCGFSARQQEENPKLYRCEHCGCVRTLDGSPPPLKIEPIAVNDGSFFEDVKKWQDEQLAKCALPPEMLMGRCEREVTDDGEGDRKDQHDERLGVGDFTGPRAGATGGSQPAGEGTTDRGSREDSG